MGAILNGGRQNWTQFLKTIPPEQFLQSLVEIGLAVSEELLKVYNDKHEVMRIAFMAF